jgi:hypothetical protein
MKVPEEDIQTAERLGVGFYIKRQDGQGKPYQTVINGISSPVEAVQLAETIEAWHVAVYTSGEGYQYWSSKNSDFVNSGVL